jgi:hypothetical protein
MSRNTIAWMKAGISTVRRPRREGHKGSLPLFLDKKDVNHVLITYLEIKMGEQSSLANVA